MTFPGPEPPRRSRPDPGHPRGQSGKGPGTGRQFYLAEPPGEAGPRAPLQLPFQAGRRGINQRLRLALLLASKQLLMSLWPTRKL